MAAPNAAASLEFFVATGGNDSNPGTRDAPFASLEAARDAVRAIRRGGPPPAGGVTVWIRGGTFPRSRSFELTAIDSGTQESPIVYRAFTNEFVRLLGGRIIRGFKPVSDSSILARLDPKARSAVVQADLRALGISDLGSMRSRGFGRPIAPAHLELFFAGQPMTLARWPNEGEWEKIAGFPEATGQGDEHGGKIGDLKNGFFYSGDRPKRWKDVPDVWVHGYWAWDWANSYERIESLDLEKRLIKTAPPHGLYGFRKGQRFYYVNVLEELDQPGEWYLDPASGSLYFWPPKPADSGEALVSILEGPLITLADVSHTTFRGLELEATRGDAVSIRGGANNLVAACSIRLIGNYGVRIDGGRNDGVVGCDIENTGDGGVSLSGGDRATLTPGGHFVDNCHFQKQGRWSKCYVPAILISGVGQRVSHNLIHDHPHCAILFGGNEHRIEFNEIHHIALETGDVGAIYAGRDWTFRGNVIRHNFIHHTGGVGMGSMSVYMDDCVSGAEIYGNIFYKVSRAAFLGGGRDHRVENNIFVDCQPGVQLDGRGLDHSPVWHNMVYDYMKKQLAAVPSELYRQRYPTIAAVDRYYVSTNGVPPEGNVVAHNISVGGKWLSVGWHAKPEMLDLRDNYVGPDPGFVDPEKMDFRLKKDSPVWKTGFKEIPVENIGLQKDEYRQGAAQGARAAGDSESVSAIELAAGFPLVNYHVHLKGGLTLAEALQQSRETGVRYGIAVNCGLGFAVTNDAAISRYLDSMQGQPVFVGMQAEGREWLRLFSKEAIARFDYVFTDAMTFTDARGKRVRLWIKDEVEVKDKQAFMDLLLERILSILNNEPIDIYVNPTFLPDCIAAEYDSLWSEERMKKVIRAAVQNGVAIEINARYRLPSRSFIRLAKQAGAKFSFGTNNADRQIGDLDYCLQMVKEFGITKEDMFTPKPDGQKPVQKRD